MLFRSNPASVVGITSWSKPPPEFTGVNGVIETSFSKPSVVVEYEIEGGVPLVSNVLEDSSRLFPADSVDHGGLLSPMKPIDNDIEIIKIAMKIDFAAFEPRLLLYTWLWVKFMIFGKNTPFISFSYGIFYNQFEQLRPLWLSLTQQSRFYNMN